MTIKRLVIGAIAFLFSFSNCKAIQKNELNMLTINEKQIEEAIKVFIKEESKYGNIEKRIVIVKIEKLENSYEIRIGALEQESMGKYLSDITDKPFGFIDYDGVPVIFWGEDEKLFFEKNDNIKSFPFLTVKPKLKIKEGMIPPPPVIYEPIVCIYTYMNGKLKLTNTGRFTLLI